MSVDIPVLLGVVIAVTFLGNALAEHARIPDALFLTGIGIVIGQVLGIVPSESMRSFMSSFGVVALAIILFRTGFELDMRRASWQVGRATLLACCAFALAIFLVYCALVIGLELRGQAAWAIASALACTSADIILPALAKSKSGQALSSLLAMESALSEAFAVILVLALSSLGVAQSADAAFWAHWGVSFLIGGGIALIVGFLWLWLLRLLAKRAFFYLLTIGLVFLLMGLVEKSGGSGGFAVLVFGMMLANANSIVESLPPGLRQRLRVFSADESMSASIGESHGQIHFFIRGFFYLYLGILFEWPGSDLRVWLGIVIASIAVILAREIAVQFAGWVSRIPGRDRMLLRLSTPRGLTTAVLAAVLLPWVGQGPWKAIVVVVVLVSNLRMTVGAAKLSRGQPAIGPGE